MTNNIIKPIKEVGFTFISKKDLPETDCNIGDKLTIKEFVATDNMYLLDNLEMCCQEIYISEQDLLQVMFTEEELTKFKLDRIDEQLAAERTKQKQITLQIEELNKQSHSVYSQILKLDKQKEALIYNGKTQSEYFRSITGSVFEENNYIIELDMFGFDLLRITVTNESSNESVLGNYNENEGKLTVKSLDISSYPTTYLPSQVPAERKESYDAMNKLFVEYKNLALAGKL